MSDCSIKAFEPKELPKTCGTCYWMMMQPGHDECGACGNPLYMVENCPRAYSHGYYEYTIVDMDCDGEYWRPKEEPTLEQRCQKRSSRSALSASS